MVALVAGHRVALDRRPGTHDDHPVLRDQRRLPDTCDGIVRDGGHRGSMSDIDSVLLIADDRVPHNRRARGRGTLPNPNGPAVLAPAAGSVTDVGDHVVVNVCGRMVANLNTHVDTPAA